LKLVRIIEINDLNVHKGFKWHEQG